ncbi:uncharacterized protein LOC127091148 [Lathyrus oleraceus]|uniref:Uncharacterized protein n=1 Tax=Pisum sativum TaxID=3888 RepID=A0A9D5A6E6_PEA|nr:uncharacterized protein LOC127091148 [Pisum sativum]KAI5399322.1 hypothetical protein KIW84_064616 [Pisum sativum]
MNSKSKPKKPTPIRVFGQRSITSTFRSLPPNPSHDSEASSTNQASRKCESTRLSLSHFLVGKLHSSSTAPHTVPGKLTPFQSPLGLRIPSSEQVGSVKQTEEERKFATADEKLILGMFKHTEEEGKCDFVLPLDVDQLENSVANDRQESRKRKNPFEGRNENQTVRKHVVVLGGESRLKQKKQIKNDFDGKKQKPYNHYANGCGWWDYDMEGVDNEALGVSEVWEGVGSTTLGGIADWH